MINHGDWRGQEVCTGLADGGGGCLQGQQSGVTWGEKWAFEGRFGMK